EPWRRATSRLASRLSPPNTRIITSIISKGTTAMEHHPTEAARSSRGADRRGSKRRSYWALAASPSADATSAETLGVESGAGAGAEEFHGDGDGALDPLIASDRPPSDCDVASPAKRRKRFLDERAGFAPGPAAPRVPASKRDSRRRHRQPLRRDFVRHPQPVRRGLVVASVVGDVEGAPEVAMKESSASDVEAPYAEEPSAPALPSSLPQSLRLQSPPATVQEATPLAKRSINSYYGHKVGALQTLSLLLNAGLMIYAHVGLSAVVLTSLDPGIASAVSGVMRRLEAADPNDEGAAGPGGTGEGGEKCGPEDKEAWIANGHETALLAQSNHCIGPFGCGVDDACIERCFQEEYGYSESCTSCMGPIPMCIISNGCALPWWVLNVLCAFAIDAYIVLHLCVSFFFIGRCSISDSMGQECWECSLPCVDELVLCMGLPKMGDDETVPQTNGTSANATLPSEADASAGAPVDASAGTEGNSCNQFDLQAIDQWHTVYNITFAESIRDTWNGDAKLLAVLIVIFSGIWPYLKNIMLLMIWYIPTSVERQTDTLLWLSRLSKYTLVDVFAVIGILVGVQLQLNLGGLEVATRAEPRFGIIAFFLATVWEFLQIELIKEMHERKVLVKGADSGPERLLFPTLWAPVLLLVTSLALYISGAVTEMVKFTSADFGSAGVCERSYNLVTLGNALISEQSMAGNSAKGQTWILYLCYVVFNLAWPILTHLLQIGFIVGWFRSKEVEKLTEWALAIWCFACIEVLLIGVFGVEFKVRIIRCTSVFSPSHSLKSYRQPTNPVSKLHYGDCRRWEYRVP
ncbi:hypothetical protein ACHAWF_005583, partial [Thalassiosira exigua]